MSGALFGSMKICARCKGSKPTSEFGVNRATRDGLHYNCRTCAANVRAEWLVKNPGKPAEYARRHRERYNQNMRNWALANNERVRKFKEAVIDRNVAHVNAFKMERGCADRGLHGYDCGEAKQPSLLEFDHVRGRKRASVSRLVLGGYSIASIEAEIGKCEVVCQMHHRIRTLTR
jgi:hypothetical protein